MKNYQDIRYTELRFTLRFQEDSQLPRFKASAIRGGMGNMLLDEYCIRENFRRENEVCTQCDFSNECIVQRILYAKMDIEPAFMSAGNSVGYIVDCEETREIIEAGDEIHFKLILFGKNIFYLSQYLSAIYRLGMNGLGKDHARFEVTKVDNVYNRPILNGNNIFKNEYKILTVGDYIKYRKKCLNDKMLDIIEGDNRNDNKYDSDYCAIEHTSNIRLKTLSPLSIKKNGEMLNHFDVKSFVDNLYRRIYIMSCFEGIETEQVKFASEDNYPGAFDEDFRYTEIPRYSGRKNQKIFLKGIQGSVEIDLTELPTESADFAGAAGAVDSTVSIDSADSVDSIGSASSNKIITTKEFLDALIAGELLHVGSNTSFGFGKYRLDL